MIAAERMVSSVDADDALVEALRVVRVASEWLKDTNVRGHALSVELNLAAVRLENVRGFLVRVQKVAP